MNPMMMMNLFSKLMQNPMQTLIESGLNVPQNLANNPQSIVQHLLNTGQITQSDVNQAIQMKDSPMFKHLHK